MAMLNSASTEDKKKQLQRWFSDEELNGLARLEYAEEIVRTDIVYPNLYSQMSYAMGDIAQLKNEILSELDKVTSEIGFGEIAEMLLDSTSLVLAEELGIKSSLSEMEAEKSIDAQRLLHLHNEIYCRINTAKHFLEIDRLQDRISRKEDVVSLAANRILI